MIALLAAAALLPSPAGAGVGHPCEGLERARGTMGTLARVVVCDATADEAEAAREARAAGAALDAIDRVDRLMSLYKPDSDLSRLNRDGAKGPVALDAWTVEVLESSLRLSRETRGTFDVTIKPLMDFYGFYSELGFSSPARTAKEAARAVGYRGLEIDASRSTARFLRPGMGVDLGGVAKGYALDRAADELRRHGVRRAILELGRSLLFLGEGPGPEGSWPAAVVDPLDSGALGTCLSVPAGSLSTSALSGRVARTAGGEVGHVLDPRRGALRTARLQATAWSESGTRAEALSKAALLLPLRRLRTLVAGRRERVLLLERGGAGGGGAPVVSVPIGPGAPFAGPCGR